MHSFFENEEGVRKTLDETVLQTTSEVIPSPLISQEYVRESGQLSKDRYGRSLS